MIQNSANTKVITITDGEFRKLAAHIEENYGIHLKEEKRTLVMGRLHKVLEEMGFKNFTQYYKYILQDRGGAATLTLIDKITTNHTYFMREADHFDFFREQVLPFWIKTLKEKDLRIWCAASSTGEESYTLAMIIDEVVKQKDATWDTKILATDISSQVLEIAKQGIYSYDKIKALQLKWKINYFKKYNNENYKIIDKIKNEVIYRRFNLMEHSFPFKKKFHIIFCRNVMIYFDIKTKDILIEKFYNSLEYGGYLFIGHSEWINLEKTGFKHIRPAVYRKEK
jgi:chemotaxis protein methyltransferase CheR